MTPLQQLTETIYTALPELKELGVGCEIKNPVTLKIYKIGIFVSESYCILDNKDRLPLTVNNKITDYYIVVGKPITLTDVLRWLKELQQTKNTPYYINTFGELMTSGNDFCCRWDLQQNLLENQSIELVEFLNNLKK